MNRCFEYDGYEIWNPDAWGKHVIAIDEFIQWVSGLNRMNKTEWELPEDVQKHEVLDSNNFKAYLTPEEIEYWDKLNMKIELHHIWIAKWISIVPKDAVRNSGTLHPTAVTVHNEDVKSPSWAMKTLSAVRESASALARNKMIVLITVTEEADITHQYSNIIMEASSLYPIDYNNISLNLSTVYEKGYTAEDFPGVIPFDENLTPIENPNSFIKDIGGAKLLDISRTWKSMGSPSWSQLIGYDGQHGGNAGYNSEWFKHSLAAKRLAEPVSMERRFKSHTEPEFIGRWEKLGLKYEAHETNHEQWITLTPKSALENEDSKIPIMLIFQEVYLFNDHLPVEATSYWYEMCKIAGQGECMLLFYACECMEHNEFMYEILKEAIKLYPIDTTRVYVSGYSHNGATAVNFAYNHPETIAAIMGGVLGRPAPGMSKEQLHEQLLKQSKIDMPCITIWGCNEHNAPVGKPTYENSGFFNEIVLNSLKAGNCPEKTEEDLKKAFESNDTATGMLGVPNDKSEVLYLEGFEHYIADVKNKDGNYHLRFVRIQNMPHNSFPTLQMLGWSYVRSFARDSETHRITELY